jgi:NADH dehydrogenase
VTNQTRRSVVIVGGGFGGLAAAKALAKAPVAITLIDRQNHHLFQPLLYQVASAGLNPSDIAQPIRHILAKQSNCEPMLANVTAIDPVAQTVATTAGTVSYDFLILATGATHAYFGHDEWAEHAPGLKSIEDALDIRRRILLAFEKADLADTDDERDRLLTFIVVGAGPTGVEMAGAIREIATQTLSSDFRRIDTTSSKVILIEAGPAVLPPFPEKLQRSALAQLESLGVDVRANTRVTDISAQGVETSEGFIPAATVIWAAGVAASALGAEIAEDTDRSGRAVVQKDLSLADLGGKPRPQFVYKDKGSLATIGRSKAVANLGPRLQFGGRIAWLLWGVVHVRSLIGFRSRVRTMGSWTWQYFTGKRGARLITGGAPHA